MSSNSSSGDDDGSGHHRDYSVDVTVTNLAGPRCGGDTIFSRYCGEVCSVAVHVEDDPAVTVPQLDQLKFTAILTFGSHRSAKKALKKLRRLLRYARYRPDATAGCFSQFALSEAHLYTWDRREARQRTESLYYSYVDQVLSAKELPVRINFGQYPASDGTEGRRSWMTLSTVQLNCLIDRLKASAHVEEIILSGHNNLDTRQWFNFADALKHHSGLRHIGLHCCSFDESRPSETVALVQALKTLTALQHLDMGENNFSEEGSVEFGAALKGLTALQHVNLYGWKIGEKGCAALVNGITDHPSLERVNFTCLRGFCDAGFDHIANALLTLPHLQKFTHQHFDAGYDAQVKLTSLRFQRMNFRIVGFHHCDIFHQSDEIKAEITDGPCPLEKCLKMYYQHLLDTSHLFVRCRLNTGMSHK
jgi:hypothetical protein